MKNPYFWQLVDEDGALYGFAVEDEQIISAAASARTLLEGCDVLGTLTSSDFAEATLAADVTSEVVTNLVSSAWKEPPIAFANFGWVKGAVSSGSLTSPAAVSKR